MAYIGRPLQVANLAVQSGAGDGSDTTPIATLDYATTTNGIAVYLDGVRQLAGTDFNVTSQTTLTFTTAPANGVGVDVYFLGLELSLPTPADGTVATAKIADDAVTLAKMASGTDGNIISYDASGNPVAIATGSDGQVLTSTGAGSPPAFEAAPGGGLVFIAEVNVSSGDAAASFLSSFSSTYDDYIVYFDNMQVTTNTAIGSVRIAIGGAAKTDSTYAYGQSGLNEGGSEVYGANTASALYRLSAGSWGDQATEVGAGWVTFHGVNAAVQKHLNSFTSFIDSNTTYVGSYGGSGYQGATTAWSGCQFLSNSGTLISGNFKLFGIKNS